MTRTVHVTHVNIPAGSTIGHGYGRTEDGDEVIFGGDWRPMRDLGEALHGSSEPIPVELEDWQVQAVRQPRNVTPHPLFLKRGKSK